MKPIVVEHITKSFDQVQALESVSFEVNEGELFGLIGPDGAGKTTLFRIINTLLKPDKGSAKVLEMDVVGDHWKIRPLLGYMPGRFALYQDLSVRENLEFFASVFGANIEENYELVEPIYAQLEPFENRLAGALSGGMKQKLALSCALIHKPKLLLLDEPTTGVDAVSRKEFWEMLHELRQKEITIMVSTPYMDEAEQCDRIALMEGGKILKIDTPKTLTQSFNQPLFAIRAKNKVHLIRTLRDKLSAASVQPFGDSVHYTDQNRQVGSAELKTYLRSEGIKAEIEIIQPDIEDLFINLMGRKAANE